MKKSRFSVARIMKILSELESGAPATELGRRHEVHAKTIALWREKYAGHEASDLASHEEIVDLPAGRTGLRRAGNGTGVIGIFD